MYNTPLMLYFATSFRSAWKLIIQHPLLRVSRLFDEFLLLCQVALGLLHRCLLISPRQRLINKNSFWLTVAKSIYSSSYSTNEVTNRLIKLITSTNCISALMGAS